MFEFFRRSMFARLVALGAVAMVTSGSQFSCSSGTGLDEDPDPIDNVDDGSGNGATFVTTLVLRDSSGTETYVFQRTQLITFELWVRNRTAESQTVTLSSPITSDFVVFRDGEESVVWAATEGRAAPAVLSSLTFAPNETKVLSLTWNQERASGTFLTRGHYDVRGLLGAVGVNSNPDSPHELRSVLKEFRVL